VNVLLVFELSIGNQVPIDRRWIENCNKVHEIVASAASIVHPEYKREPGVVVCELDEGCALSVLFRSFVRRHATRNQEGGQGRA